MKSFDELDDRELLQAHNDLQASLSTAATDAPESYIEGLRSGIAAARADLKTRGIDLAPE